MLLNATRQGGTTVNRRELYDATVRCTTPKVFLWQSGVRSMATGNRTAARLHDMRGSSHPTWLHLVGIVLDVASD